MEFRTATPDDAERILQFWNESGASMGATDHVEHVRRVAANPAAVLILALANDEIIGTLLGAFDGWRGNMYRLVVHPNHRRRGVGRQLVRQVEDVFAGWGVKRVTVLIEVDRPWAMDFWTAVGYPPHRSTCRYARTFGELVTRLTLSIRVLSRGKFSGSNVSTLPNVALPLRSGGITRRCT